MNEYAPKELAAFEGILSLLRSGTRFDAIKVQDIATAAGVGKGTLYEYFSSKEELLCRALLYHRQKEMEEVWRRLKGKTSFREMLFTFLDILLEAVCAPYSSFRLLLSNIGGQGVERYFRENAVETGPFSEEFDLILDSIAEQGVAEGILSDHPIPYRRMAMRGLSLSYVSRFRELVCAEEDTVLAVKKDILGMILKILG